VKYVLILCAALLSISAAPATNPDTAWLQWGGPRRDFTVNAPALVTSWPASGPKQLWKRQLGEGHSAFVVEDGRLYTMYRPAGQPRADRAQERVIALDAASGKTLWEHSYEEKTQGLDLSEGAGPHATPLIVGNRLYTVSSRVQLFALDKASGKLLWSHDLIDEYGASLDPRGYSSSPLAYQRTIIVPTGAPKGSVLAFDRDTGALVWRGGSFPVGAASPIVINVDGQEQLVVTGANEIVGMNPTNGTVLWSHPHKTDWGLNISTPVWAPGNLLFVTAAYNNGARLLKLTQANGKTSVSEQWFQNRMRVHIGTVIRVGDMVVGSSGDFGPCPTVGLDLKTGKILWQNREFARSTFLRADDKLIVLDEDGTLGVVRVNPQGMQVLARTALLTNRAWTVPTVVGTTLYVRDRRQAVAVNLGG
jgi:outer membrane protein assembly factor BamB